TVRSPLPSACIGATMDLIPADTSRTSRIAAPIPTTIASSSDTRTSLMALLKLSAASTPAASAPLLLSKTSFCSVSSPWTPASDDDRNLGTDREPGEHDDNLLDLSASIE